MLDNENRDMKTYKEESREIVKRIENPNSEPEKELVPYSSEVTNYKDTTYEHSHYEHDEYEYTEYEDKPKKRILPLLFGLTAVGAIGYFGLNYLGKEDSKQIKEVKAPVAEEKNGTKENKDELLSYYVNKSLGVDKEAKTEDVAKPTVAVVNDIQPLLDKEKVEKENNDDKELINQIVKEQKALEERAIEKRVVEEEKAVEKREVQEESSVEKVAVANRVVIPTIEKIEPEPAPIKKKVQRVKYERIKPRIITVRDGDSLASIAQRFYGNPMDFKRIIRANYKIKSSRTHLRPGQKIVIPRKDNKKTRRYIVVMRGDTLASISKNVYGTRDNISKIIRANYKIKTKRSTLHLGQKVYVPR